MKSIKNNEVMINDTPFSKWTSKEWNLWKGQTQALLHQCDRIHNKLFILAKQKGVIF